MLPQLRSTVKDFTDMEEQIPYFTNETVFETRELHTE